MAEVKPALEELPRDVRDHVARTTRDLPELAETFARTYPTEQQERRHNARKRALEQQRAEAARLEQRKKAEDVLGGVHGARARAAAESALRQCGEQLTAEAVRMILNIVKDEEANRAKR